MLVLRDLVVPVDFESTSHQALAYARELAGTFGARLHLIHVLDDTFALAPEPREAFRAFRNWRDGPRVKPTIGSMHCSPRPTANWTRLPSW